MYTNRLINILIGLVMNLLVISNTSFGIVADIKIT